MSISLCSTLAITVLLAPAGVGLLAAPAHVAAAPSQTRADRARASNHYQAGWNLYNSEAFDEAAKEFSNAVALDAEHDLAHYGLGRSYMALKRYVEAIEAYRTSRRLFQQSVGDRFSSLQDRRQRWQEQLRELDEAIRQTQQGTQNTNSSRTTRLLQEQQQRIRQNMDREQGETIDTTVPAFLSLALGSAHFRAQQFAEAEVEYKACLEADPKAGEAWNNLAVIYMLTDRLPEAERAVAAAEKTGYTVNQGLKDEIAKRGKG